MNSSYVFILIFIVGITAFIILSIATMNRDNPIDNAKGIIVKNASNLECKSVCAVGRYEITQHEAP